MVIKRRNIGPAFGDYIGFESNKSRRRFDSDEGGAASSRSYLLPFFLLIAFAILLLRLFIVQVFQGTHFRILSDTNRSKTTVIYAPRGIIFDRNGTPLVFNVPGFRTNSNGKIVLLTRGQALSLLAAGRKDIAIDSLREYTHKDAFAHLLGYIGQITKEELEDPSFSSYNIGDLVGKSGIEEYYEATLKGIDGKALSEIDANGKIVRTLGLTDPIPGLDVILTIDAKLQQASFLAMENIKKGAVIVATPNGEILTLLSKPSFDPNLFTMGQNFKITTQSAYLDLSEVLLDSQNQPLLNRAISGTYPPGSTFKLVTAAAGLESGAINKDYEVFDSGVITVGAFSFANWYFTQYGKTEGMVDVVKGIKRSNDVFFYKVAEEVGVEKLSEKAAAFGLGKTLGIDLVGEAAGLVPSNAWKQKAIGEGWYLGDTYHYGIGQGYLLTTPLQVNAWTQVIANGGVLYEPHLLKTQNSKLKTQKLISEDTRELIRQGMIESCAPGGVAWPLFKLKIKNEKLKIDGKNFLEPTEATSSANPKDYREITVACKTGTAQHGGERDLPHAWITLFAPAFDPQIVVTVLAESSGEGSNIAAPIAKKVLEEWFSR